MRKVKEVYRERGRAADPPLQRFEGFLDCVEMAVILIILLQLLVCLSVESLMIVVDVFMRDEDHEAVIIAHHRFRAMVIEALPV